MTAKLARTGPATVGFISLVTVAFLGLAGCQPPTRAVSRPAAGVPASSFTPPVALASAAGSNGRPAAGPAAGGTPSATPASTTSPAMRVTTSPGIPPSLVSLPSAPLASPPTANSSGKLLFGLGPALDSDAASPIAAGLGMFTTWYNSPSDLGFLRDWASNRIPQTYASGRSIHLVVWLDGTGKVGTNQTSHGPACGRDYPLSTAFLDDTRQLADIFKGAAGGPPLYVTLFTEFQTYACQTNAWAPSPEVTNYYLALKDKYLAAMSIFHSVAPNAKVSLGWGGWQARYDDPSTGGGRSMFPYFADVMRQSDFQSFQAMQSDSNSQDILDMTRMLGQYGPVMVAHFKPDNGSQKTWTADLKTLFTDAYIRQATSMGLFALSFMDQVNLATDPTALSLVRSGIDKYGVFPTAR